MTATTRLFTFFHGKAVGQDAFGNAYFCERRKPKGRREKRWVRYARASFFGDLLGGGLPDPSRVPAEWHGWLHYTTDTPPTKSAPRHHAWEKPHQVNPTGTQNAYLPSGHLQKSGQHAPTIAEYEPWRP